MDTTKGTLFSNTDHEDVIQSLQTQIDNISSKSNQKPEDIGPKDISLPKIPHGPGSNFSADKVDGIDANTIPMPFCLVPLGANSKFPVSVIPTPGANAITGLTGDVTATGPGNVPATVVKVDGVAYPTSPSTNTVPVVTSANQITYEIVPIAAGGTGTAGINLLQSAVVMFPTNPLSTSNIWTILAPDGSTVSQGGTTTSGLQEAINYATTNGVPLRVIGGGSTSGGVTRPFIACSTGITIPAVNQWSAIFYDVNITFTTGVNGPAFSFDSAEVSDFLFLGGQIVYQPASPGATSFCVYVKPVNATPTSAVIAYTASRIYISNIACPATGTGIAVWQFDITNGSIDNCFFGSSELNGTGSGVSANMQYGINIVNAQVTTAFEQNILDFSDIHKVTLAGVQVGATTTNQGNYRHNLWRLGGIRPSGASSDGFNTYGSYDIVQIGGITNEEGTLNRGLITEPGAVGNIFIYGQITGNGGSAVVDSGSNSIFLNNGSITATSFTGSGAGLTSLNASTLSGGTIPNARFQQAWSTWVPSWTGFSANPTVGFANYIQVGKLITAYISISAAGTSNNTAHTVTLPVSAKNIVQIGVGLAMDNGTYTATGGSIITRAGSTTADIYINQAVGAWTASGNSLWQGTFSYEAA
jgi:hypothetical protein